METLGIIAVLIGLVNTILLVVLIARSGSRAAGVDSLREELRAQREEAARAARESREELASSLERANSTISTSLTALGELQRSQLDAVQRQLAELSESNTAALERVRTTVDARVKELQEGNEKKLEEMRRTVDEKLHDTLEKRLGESFKLVSERLEAVHHGLGEMQKLAADVGGLKQVLTNVKARGTWAEVQLGYLLEETLTPAQYERNVRTRPDSTDFVEFAIRLPGSKDDPDSVVYLPIDSKFPQEDYARLQEAADAGDPAAVQRATEALTRAIRTQAQTISSKYLNPPLTTDFAIMFLPTEGLYAEVLRQPGLVEELQQRYRVTVAGPTTLTALLNALRMGFQTLAIEQRSAEVWRILGAVKTEFGKFSDVLAKVKRQLQTAERTIGQTETRTRAMERQLRNVEGLPEAEASQLLRLPTLSSSPPAATDDEPIDIDEALE